MVGVLLLVLVLPRLTLAASLILTWDWPRAHDPQPTHFLITATNVATGQTDQLRTPPSSIAACAHLPDVTADTFCTQMPDCPPEGVYVFTAQAVVGTEVGAPNDPPMACQFTAMAPCQCLPVMTELPAAVTTIPTMPIQPQPLATVAPIVAPGPMTVQTPPPMPTFPVLPAVAPS